MPDGVLLVADNPSASLHKISEIYDNIAFSGAGKYSEFENLRKAGIRHADLKGFMYSREDVTARSLANCVFANVWARFSVRNSSRWKWKFWSCRSGATVTERNVSHLFRRQHHR